MSSPPVSTALSRMDAFAFSRALAGQSWQELALSPLACALLSRLNLTRPADRRFLHELLAPDLLAQVMAINPAKLPAAPESESLSLVPSLPANARLTSAQNQEASTIGRWLGDYVSWASAVANETPQLFLEGTGLYLAAVAVGRRLYVATPWSQRVYPNLYLMVVAVSTYYRKSAGLNLAGEIARAAIPHMLLPQPGSPENFMNMLGGVMPANIETIPAADRERLEKGNRFAAQRGILRDEISGLFKSMGRDYMSGMKELIMQLYDCPAYLDTTTNNRGMVVVRDTALSILGAATPAELSHALTASDWYNGNLARFALLTPEVDYVERPVLTREADSSALVQRLRTLHERLPMPQETSADHDHHSNAWSLVADIWPYCHAYEQALRRMTAPNGLLDDRLRAVYGRLHVQALKIAILLAAMDWADGDGAPHPIIRPPYWFRAQQIVEAWRASAHRLLLDVGESEELRMEDRILSLLRAKRDGLTLRGIYRQLRTNRRTALEALTSLEQDGRVERVAVPNGGRPGPRTTLFCPSEDNEFGSSLRQNPESQTL